MDFQINVLNFALKTFTVFLDNFEIKVIVMHWLSFFDVFLVLQDIGEQFVLFGNEVIKKCFKRIANSQLSVGDGFYEL